MVGESAIRGKEILDYPESQLSLTLIAVASA